jgi:hypothetical protein
MGLSSVPLVELYDAAEKVITNAGGVLAGDMAGAFVDRVLARV